MALIWTLFEKAETDLNFSFGRDGSLKNTNAWMLRACLNIQLAVILGRLFNSVFHESFCNICYWLLPADL